MIMKQHLIQRGGFPPRAIWAFLLCGCVAFILVPIVQAQSTEPVSAKAADAFGAGKEGDSSSKDAIEALETRLAETDGKLEEYNNLEKASSEGTVSLPPDVVQARGAALRKLKAALQQHVSILRVYGDILDRRARAEAALRDFKRIEEPPPYTIAFLDQMSTALKVKQKDVDAEKVTLQTTRERAEMERPDVATAKATLNRAEERLRTAAQEERETAAFAVDTERLLLEANQAELDMAVMDAKRTEAYVTTLESDLELARRKTDLVRRQTLFTQEELDAITARQQTVIDDLDREIKETQDKIEALKAKLPGAEQKAAEEVEPEALDRAKQAVQLVHMELEAFETGLSILESLQEMEKGVVKLWELRFQIANPELAREDLDWSMVITTLEERLGLLEKEREAGEQRADNLRGQVDALESNLRDAAAGTRQFLQSQLNILSGRILLRNRYQQRMTQILEIGGRFLDEAKIRRDARPLLESLQEYGLKMYGVVTLAFDREITEIGGESITGRKLFYMLLILAGGVLFSRLLTRYIRIYALRKLKLRSNVVLIIAKLTNYVTFILVVYLALNYVNIPLTIFTFMGGAIALGVGFGAQNLINNFLSGLILMGEQPIRLGDIVEIEGKLGTITNIGARASSLRMFNGFDLLIPNSKFLETSVINWTLSDARIRLQVEVGVAYGSNTREVARLMMYAVTEHGQILSDPEPKVIFEAFGENALQFCVYFWVELAPSVDSRVIMSDIRYRIDKLFREAGIEIAYPQRDIHLDSISPLELRLLRDGERGAGESAVPEKSE